MLLMWILAFAILCFIILGIILLSERVCRHVRWGEEYEEERDMYDVHTIMNHITAE